MNPTEGAFARLCRSLTAEIERQHVATLRVRVVAALLDEAATALAGFRR